LLWPSPMTEATRREGTCCRSALVECAAASTEVSVLYMFSMDATLRELAKSALLCAHACTRSLRALHKAEHTDQPHWHEMRVVARLCEAFANECGQDDPEQHPPVEIWQRACLDVADSCKKASDVASQKWLT
jgi:hypothetical protein